VEHTYNSSIWEAEEGLVACIKRPYLKNTKQTKQIPQKTRKTPAA
jgi:hypothetical protein